jgi:signal transduction histidine kinase
MMSLLQGRDSGRLIALVVVCLLLHSHLYAQSATDTEPKRVLALHVVRRDSPRFDDAFRSVIEDAMPGRVDYYSEYIALNRIGDGRYQSALSDYLRSRYSVEGVDVVIASGPSVVEFLNSSPSLFHGVPIVFATRPGMLGGELSTGIVSAIEFTETLKAALAAHPDTKQVFVVSGVAAFDQTYADLFRAQSAPFASQVTFIESTGLALPEIEAHVRALPKDSIVFYLSLTQDGAGRMFMPLDALDAVASAAGVPVYSWHEDALGHGIIGGHLHSSIRDARETAALALRVLRGESPTSIPVVTFDSHTFQYDWRQLQRWQISEASLPAGSQIHFREQSAFEQYRWYIVGGVFVLVAQGLLIGGLLIQGRRRRRAEDALRQSEARKTAILRALPDLMFVIDRNGTYVDYHARDPGSLFASPDSFLGRNIREVMPAPLADTFMAALEQTIATDEPVVVDYELPMDELRHYEARLVPADEGRVLSIVRDVTESTRAIEMNRDLAGRLIVSQEEERQRIARELHDDLSQKIALLNLEVDQIAKDAGAEEHRSRLVHVSSKVREIASELSHLSHRLHPSRLETLGLIESVRLLCSEISQQRQLNVMFTSGGLPKSVDPGVALCLYRITQEALHNVAKHSQARVASVELTKEGDQLHLRIADSGVGFDPITKDRSGLGLMSMRERVGVLRGHLVISASPGRGTRIGVRVPLKPPRRDEHANLIAH